jgi:hypothetical protein
MAMFLATLSAAGASNWAICKHHALWGTGTSPMAKKAARQVAPGDDLFVWQSGAGLIARARIVTTARAVSNIGEVPWPNPQRYSYTFGIDVQQELSQPIGDRFKDYRSIRFGIRTHELQAGFIQVNPEVAASLRSAFEAGTDSTDFDEPQGGTGLKVQESPEVQPDVPHRDRRWARPMAGVYLRSGSTVTEVLLALYRRVADDEDGEMVVVGDERDRVLVERELSHEPFIEMRGRVRFVTSEELAAELQRRFPRI